MTSNFLTHQLTKYAELQRLGLLDVKLINNFIEYVKKENKRYQLQKTLRSKYE